MNTKKDYSIWITKDNRKIKIKDMDTNHIINCLKMLKSKNFFSLKTFNFYMNCNLPNGEMALDLFFREFNMVTSKVYQYIDYFIKILKERNIEYKY